MSLSPKYIVLALELPREDRAGLAPRLVDAAGDEVGEQRAVLRPAQEVAARGEAQARARPVVAGVGHVVGAADLHDARVLAAARQLVGLGRHQHRLAAAGEA